MTISPGERHNYLAIRLSRYRQRDPFVALERTEMLSDVVHTTDLRAFLMTQMQQCASLVGPNRYQAALAAVEPAMLQHLNPSSRPPPSPPPK